MWLARRVNDRDDFIKRAKSYFNEHQGDWSKGVVESFVSGIEKVQDTQYFEENRFEILAWRVIKDREH